MKPLGENGSGEDLDREHQAFRDVPHFLGLVPGRDEGRILMQRAADAMARQISDQRVAVAVGEFLH